MAFLKIKSSVKSSGKSLKGIEKSMNFTISVGFNTVDGGLNQNEIVLPLFGAVNSSPNKWKTISY